MLFFSKYFIFFLKTPVFPNYGTLGRFKVPKLEPFGRFWCELNVMIWEQAQMGVLQRYLAA